MSAAADTPAAATAATATMTTTTTAQRITECVAELSAATKTFLNALKSRSGEYARRIVAPTEYTAARIAALSAAAAAADAADADAPALSADIYSFAGVPYAPVGDDLPPTELASPRRAHSRTPSSPTALHKRNATFSDFPAVSAADFAADTRHVVDIAVHRGPLSALPSKVSANLTTAERSLAGGKVVFGKAQRSPRVHVAVRKAVSAVSASHTITAPALVSPSMASRSSQFDAVDDAAADDDVDDPTLPRPVTAVVVAMRHSSEEAPFNFTLIDRSLNGDDAALIPPPSMRSPYLCLYRGDGAPLSHLGFINRQVKETLPPQWHEARLTPNGHIADLSADAAIPAPQTDGLFLCFRLDVRPVIARWNRIHRAAAVTAVHPLFDCYGRLLCALSATLYSGDVKLILTSFECARRVHSSHIPAALINRYLKDVCDAAHLLISALTSSNIAVMMRYLLHVFRHSLPLLTNSTIIAIINTCALCRHEDKQNEISQTMIQRSLSAVDTVHPCICRRHLVPDDVVLSTANALASPAASPHRKFSRRLCFRCTFKARLSSADVSAAARMTISAAADAVVRAADLNDLARQFDRQTANAAVVTPSFVRCAAAINKRLEDVDRAFEQAYALPDDVVTAATNPVTGNRRGGYFSFRRSDDRPLEDIIENSERKDAPSTVVEEAAAVADDTGSSDAESERSKHRRHAIRIVPASAAPSSSTLNVDRSPSKSRSVSAQSSFAQPNWHDDHDDETNHAHSKTIANTNGTEDGDGDGDGDGDRRVDTAAVGGGKSAAENDSDGDEEGTVLDAPSVLPSLSSSSSWPQPTTSFVPPALVISPSSVLSTTDDGNDVAADQLIPMTPLSVVRTVSINEEKTWNGTAQSLAPHSYSDECTFRLHILLLCKIIGAAPAAATTVPSADSESLRRKHDALHLLFVAMTSANAYFTHSLAASLLLRRFVVPAILRGAVTDSSSIFRVCLRCAQAAWTYSRTVALVELGAMFEHCLIPMLTSTAPSAEHKMAILELFDIAILNPQTALLNFFYNFECRSSPSNIFSALTLALCKLLVGSDTTNHDSDESDVKTSEVKLSLSAATTIVHLFTRIAEIVGVDGASSEPSRPPSLRPLVPLPSDTRTSPAVNKPTLYRRGSWSARRHCHLAVEKLTADFIVLSRRSLRDAIKHLIKADAQYKRIDSAAEFLFRNAASLDSTELGDLLFSEFVRDLYSAKEATALRSAYCGLVDFSAMTMDSALRMYLTDCGFRLPGEGQKIDRALTAFAYAYCRDNPTTFRKEDSAVVLAFSLVMLNVDAHNPKILSEKKMTLEQFISNLRGVDDKQNFDRTFLESMYFAVKNEEIKMNDNDTSNAAANVNAATSSAGVSNSGAPSNTSALNGVSVSDQRTSRSRALETLSRRASSVVRRSLSCERTFIESDDASVAIALYESMAKRVLNALAVRSEAVHSQSDVTLMHAILDALALGAAIGIKLGLSADRTAYSIQLARLIYVEKARDTQSISALVGRHSGTISERLANDDHLKEMWYRQLNLQALKYPAQACDVIFHQVSEVKQQIFFDRGQAALRRIESDFDGAVVLMDSNRHLIKRGKLTKLSAKGARHSYMFFLFTDLILYASDGIQTRYKVHRVVHLSLCRLEDVRSNSLPNAFKIVSPQKTFTVQAKSPTDKKEWLDAILTHLRDVMLKRANYLHKAHPDTPTAAAATQLTALASVATSRSTTVPPSLTSPTNRATSPLHGHSQSTIQLNANAIRNGHNDAAATLNAHAHNDFRLKKYSTFIGSDSDLRPHQRHTPQSSSANGLSLTSSSRSLSSSGKSVPNHCKLCIRPFNALFRRRTRCKWCADTVCTECCTQRARMPNVQGEANDRRLVVVCDACYGALIGMVGENVPMLTITEYNDTTDILKPDRRKTL